MEFASCHLFARTLSGEPVETTKRDQVKLRDDKFLAGRNLDAIQSLLRTDSNQ